MVLYDYKLPAVKFNSIDSFINTFKYSNEFVLHICFNEKEISNPRELIIECEGVIQVNGKTVIIYMEKKVYRNTKILTRLNKGF
jgi:hypothetical protein